MEDVLSFDRETKFPTVLILAGGAGTRLRSEVPDVPKPMAPAAGKPFLFYLVRHLWEQGFRDFVFSLHHQAEKIRAFFTDFSEFKGARYRFVVEPKPLQTGGAILWSAFETALDQPFLVLNGDTLLSGDLRPMVKMHRRGELTIALSRVSDVSRYGTVITDLKSMVLGFQEKAPDSRIAGTINAGAYLMEKESLEQSGFCVGDAFSIEKDVFPTFIGLGKIQGVLIPGTFIDIGIPEDYRRFKSQVEK